MTFFFQKLKQSPEALPLMNGGLKNPGIEFGFRYNSQSNCNSLVNDPSHRTYPPGLSQVEYFTNLSIVNLTMGPLL